MPALRSELSASPRFGLGAALVATVAIRACSFQKKPPPLPPPPPTVYVTPVRRGDVPLFIESVGSLDGYVNADIRARVRGYLESQDYKDGSSVRSGQVLFRIEKSEYVAAVEAARAALEQARVDRKHAHIQLDRDRGLNLNGLLPRQDLDTSIANAAASVGRVEGAEADLARARLNLSYTDVRAPIDGVAGIALVRIGNLVGQDGPTLLTTVSAIDPMRVDFPISEVDYLRYPERFERLENRDVRWARRQFEMLEASGTADRGDPGIELVLSDGSTYPHRAVVVAVNRQIDPSTGTLRLQALVPNPEGLLRPGGYARVRIPREKEGRNVLYVPERALVSVQGTYSVAVVRPDSTGELRRVDLGPATSGVRVVEKGLTEGERVVVEGQQKVKSGARVEARPAREPPPPGPASAAPPGAPGP
jgi:membrane fusion protein (multidrug efflux system)